MKTPSELSPCWHRPSSLNWHRFGVIPREPSDDVSALTPRRPCHRCSPSFAETTSYSESTWRKPYGVWQSMNAPSPSLLSKSEQAVLQEALKPRRALGRVGADCPDLAVPALIEALGSSNADISRSAARSLARLGSTVLPHLGRRGLLDNRERASPSDRSLRVDGPRGRFRTNRGVE